MLYDVFVPTDPEQAPQGLRRGAPILRPHRARRPLFSVGMPPTRGEGFADACRAAVAGRRRAQITDGLVCVGIWDEHQGELRPHPGRDRALCAWAGRVLYRNDLEAADSRANQRQEARQEMRRAYMQGNLPRAAAIANRHGIRHW